jgi:hypothetical protein
MEASWSGVRKETADRSHIPSNVARVRVVLASVKIEPGRRARDPPLRVGLPGPRGHRHDPRGTYSLCFSVVYIPAGPKLRSTRPLAFG